MSLSRVKTWNPGDVLTAADLNGEFDNFINHPIAFISPTTGPINFNLQAHSGLLPSVITASSGTTGSALIVTSSGGAQWSALPAFYNLDLRTSGVTISNTAVESTVYSVTIPGGTFQGGSRQLAV